MIRKIIMNVAFVAALLCAVACERGGDETKRSNIEIYVEEVDAKAEGETLRLNYAITTPIDGETLVVECSAEWISQIKVATSFIQFVVEPNNSGEKREAVLNLSYGKSKSTLRVKQTFWQDPLAVIIEKVEATAVTFSVVALDDTTTWIGQVVGKDWFDAYSEEEIFDEDYRYYNEMASEAEVSLSDYLDSMLSRGSHSGLRMGGLDIESDYVVYVYGMNNLGEMTTSIYSAAFTTTAPYQGNDVTYDIDVQVERAIADITITPSHEGVAYFNNLITREDYEAYGGDINKAADAVIAKIIDDYAAWEYTLAETFDYNTDYVATNYQFEALANTEYVAFAFKWNEKCERMSEVSYKWFTIGDIPPSDNQLSMTISDVTQTTFFVETTVTNNDPYVIFPVPAMEIVKMRTDKDIFNYLIKTYGTSGLNYYLCEGAVKGTFSGLEQATDYAVLIFGYEAGVLTTSIQRVDITTAKAGDIDACIYTIEVNNIGDREAEISITPSDYSVWYYWNVFEADATEEQILEFIENSYNREYYADYWEFSYYEIAQGKVTSYLGQLSPSTDYKIAIVPMNPDRFEYTGTMRFGGEFRTEEAIIADITITAGFEAYYDGDEAYALLPDYMTSYKGYVIIPMTVEVDGEFSRYLYTIFDYIEGLENPEEYSDDTLIDNLYEVGAYWSPAYFRGVWDKPMMIAAVAFDMAGNPSRVYRECFTCEKSKAGDAEEFIYYYMGGVSSLSSGRRTVDCGLELASVVVPESSCSKRKNAALRKQGAKSAPYGFSL